MEATFDERTNSVIVTAPRRRSTVIEALIKQARRQPASRPTTSSVFQLKNADAFDVALAARGHLQAQGRRAGEDDGFFRFIFFGSASPRQEGPEDDGRLRRPHQHASSSPRPSEMLKAIEDVITKLDTNPASRGDAVHLPPAQRARRPTSSSCSTRCSATSRQPGQQGRPEPGRQQPGPAAAPAVATTATNNGGIDRGNRRPQQPQPGQPPRNRSGRPQHARRSTPGLQPRHHRADRQGLRRRRRRHQLAARHDRQPSTRSRSSEIIDELDRPVPQVLIKVLVAEVTHDDDVDFGVDFSDPQPPAPAASGQTLGTNFGNAADATGGLVVSACSRRTSPPRSARCDRSGKLDVLSRPYILASDNQLASITVGQEVPFITNTPHHRRAASRSTRSSTSDVGIILDVTPHINPDGPGDPGRGARRSASSPTRRSPVADGVTRAGHRQALGREPRRRCRTGRRS